LGELRALLSATHVDGMAAVAPLLLRKGADLPWPALT
jgi:hypothetical protein